jgi:hypothetical protein
VEPIMYFIPDMRSAAYPPADAGFKDTGLWLARDPAGVQPTRAQSVQASGIP